MMLLSDCVVDYVISGIVFDQLLFLQVGESKICLNIIIVEYVYGRFYNYKMFNLNIYYYRCICVYKMFLFSLNSLGDKLYVIVKFFILEYINNLVIFLYIVFYSIYCVFF